MPSQVFDGSRPPSPQEAAVLQAMHALSGACIAVDSAALAALTSSALSYSHADGRVQTQAEYIAALLGGQSVFRSIDLSGIRLQIAGDCALVQHHARYSTFVKNTPGVSEVDVGQVWQNNQGHHGQWQLLLRNARKSV